jgi:hypothetical protein
MKVLKIALIVIGAIVVLLLIMFGIYLLSNIQGEAESFEVNSPELEQKVLIASQGSDFKNALVESLTTYIHTTEMNKVQSDVKAYLDKAHDLDKVIIITTSGPGDWKTDKYDVDIITSASKKQELPSLISTILTKLDVILKTETM